MATASLTVRVLADIDSFSKGMSKAERELMKTGQRMQSLGQKLSLGVTLPFVALGSALAKSAAEDEASVKKLERAFGSSTAAMEGFTKDLMKTVPATDDALRGLTVSTDTLLRSMGLGVPKATAMTQAVTKLAGDLAAFNHVTIDVAQNTLEKALAGQTRGLKEFGIVINEADIKARAYSLGLAKQGDALSHAATAQASWSLILERSKAQQGEAARTIGEASNAMARLRQSADSAADSFGTVFLPVAAKVVDAISRVLKGLADMPQGTKAVIVGIGGIAAVAGPAIFILGSLTEKAILLTRALRVLSGTTALAGLTSVLGTLLPLVAILGAPLAASAFAFHKEGEAARQAAGDLDAYRTALTTLTAEQLKGQLAFERSKLAPLKTQAANIQQRFATEGPSQSLIAEGAKLSPIMAAAEARVTAITARLAEMNKTAADTDDAFAPAVDSLKDIETQARLITESFKQMSEGWAVPGLTTAWAAALDVAYTKLGRIKNALDPIAVQLRSIINDLTEAAAIGMPTNANLPGVQFAKPTAPETPIPKAEAGKVVIGTISLPAPQAAALPQIPQQLSTIRQAMTSGFQQVSVAIGDTLATRLGAMFGGRGVGAQIGGALGGAFGGGIGTVLGKAAAESIGGLLGAGVGSMIPVVGTLIGGALGSAIGGLFGRHKKEVDRSADSMANLAKTVDRVTQSITNIPAFFKVEGYRFDASPIIRTPTSVTPVPTTPPPYGQPPGGRKPDDPPPPILPGDGTLIGGNSFHVAGDIILNGVQNVKELLDELATATMRQAATGSAKSYAFASGGLG